MTEDRVLLATARWLQQQGCQITAISPPTGKDLPSPETQRERFAGADFNVKDIHWPGSGPDLVAEDKNVVWKVECKGLSKGTPQTVDTNFDRALASVVCYYCDGSLENNKEYLQQNVPGPRIDPGIRHRLVCSHDPDMPVRPALALPQGYRKHLSKIPGALRRRLDLWILIVDPETDMIDCYDPQRKL